MKTLAKLPVTIVTGFLGSGKTTLLRHMLDNAQGRRIAVIVNEFGELGIDGEILKQCSIGCTEEEANGRVYELANGCLCCTVQDEFFPVMRELVARRGDLSVPEVAVDFGVAEESVRRWMKQADVEDGKRAGLTEDERKQLREANKRIRLLEQENEVLRRAAAYLSQANLPGK